MASTVCCPDGSSPCQAHVSPEDTSSEEPPKSAELKEQSRSKGDSETHGSKPEPSADISQITDEDKKSALNQQPAETCPDCASKESQEGAEGIKQEQQKDTSVKSLEGEMAAMDVCEGKRDWRPQTVSDVLRMQGVEQLYAVQPLPWCPHLNSVQPLPQEGLDTHAPCQDCGDLKENWVCLTCYKVLCSRFVQEHMAGHSKDEGHPLVLSYRDLSVWCYDCNEYVDNKITHPMKNAAHEDKFGETLPETA
ncbi:histone deacetylase 6-like [Pomacea canaliculata]|uniref:histone deacetylase 6-like n=1 Tax=Pomacea canaliculata TaxID=400727 RepID=UPI000D73ABE5|nr:histone deacetylase 6-like [Pomacea canaliculata]